jgi:hypothetical protein
MVTANSGTPKPIGCAITKADIAKLSAPTPIRKPLDQSEISLYRTLYDPSNTIKE